MQNYNNLLKNEYLNPVINNENSNANLNIENQIKNPNINKGPKKAFRKRSNIHTIDFELSHIKTNNFINEANPNHNENCENFINNNSFITNNNNVNIPGIIGGNDNNYNNQFNNFNKIIRNETFTINGKSSFKNDDSLKEAKKNHNITERRHLTKNNHILAKDCKSTLNKGIIDNSRKIYNLKQNHIRIENSNINNININGSDINKNNKINSLERNKRKIENQNINNITIQTNRINRNENENQYTIPQFNKTINNENRKRKEIIPSYYNNLYRKYKQIFGDINIFNSILIMLNNILDVNILLNLDKMKEQIQFINNNFKYSLASILYHSKQYIWDNEEIYSINIFNKYTEFIYCFLNLNYANNEKCLFDINNMEKI